MPRQRPYARPYRAVPSAMSPSPLGDRPVTNATLMQPIRPDLWLLDPEVAHLNHGSYGAVPRPVLEAQRRAAEAIERSPERFYRAELAPAVDGVRRRVAEFLATDPDGLVLLQNATEAVQVVLSSLPLEPLAEIVYTDHTYPWVKAAIERARAERGVVPRCVALPNRSWLADVLGPGLSDGLSEAEFAAALVTTLKGALNERTALVVLDQITSASALRLPVEAVCAELGDQVPVLIDGAHAPGLIDAPVPKGAAFWLGNLHKWAFAARTAAALVVAPAWRERVRPLVASAGAARGFPGSFSYLGTQDPTAYLALPAALAFPADHLGMTFRQLRERNTAVLELGLARLHDALGWRLPPGNGLPMRAVPLGRAGGDAEAGELGGRLREKGVEVAMTSPDGQLHLRLSVQAYVGVEEFARLATALAEVV